MTMTAVVQSILRNDEGENPGMKAQSVRILMQHRLSDTSRKVVSPSGHGFDDGPNGVSASTSPPVACVPTTGSLSTQASWPTPLPRAE